MVFGRVCGQHQISENPDYTHADNFFYHTIFKMKRKKRNNKKSERSLMTEF